MEEYSAWLELQVVTDEEKLKRKAFEDSLRKTVKNGDIDEIIDKLTPRALSKCNKNALLMAMETNFALRRLAEKQGPDEEDLTKLASTLDEFIFRLFDPLKSGGRIRDVFLKAAIDDVMEAAIEFEQKNFFAHPVINNLMTEKWHGELGSKKKQSWLTMERWTWGFLNFWCLFDLLLFPFLFVIFGAYHFGRKKIRNRKGVYINKSDIYVSYNNYFNTPYFIFLRDTLTYLIHLGLHFAVCLAPSSISFSSLEWAIWVFFMARVVMESKQFADIKVHRINKEEIPQLEEPMDYIEVAFESQESSIKTRTSSFAKKFSKYLSDQWNVLDLLTLIIYLVIFVLRMVTWTMSESVENDRALVIAGYLYGLNTMVLTLRAFGHMMENTREVGSIQIALFHILSDVVAIFWQFIAAILAFSIAITKVYMAEKSYLDKDEKENNSACSSIGYSCWWTIAKHLIWSLLGVVELDPLNSTDIVSATVVRFLYGAYLIMGVVLLINMMIALLSNTYQRVQENSLKEWSFKKAIRIQTYSSYHPVPIPFNLISNLVLGLRWFWRSLCVRRKRSSDGKSRTRRSRMEQKILKLNEESLDLVVKNLQLTYFATYGYAFPLTAKGKMDRVLHETTKIRNMANQVAYKTFTTCGPNQRSFPVGSKAWKSEGIRIEGCLLMYEGVESCQKCQDQPTMSQRNHGARYLVPFSPECPHFEVLILEGGERRSLEVGVARKNYQSHVIRGQGWKNECVGYHIKGDILDAVEAKSVIEIEDAMADRGDLIGCRVLFEKAEKGKAPITFTLNGRPITQNAFYIQFDQEDLMLFPFVSIGHEGVVVAAYMRSCDNTRYGIESNFTASTDNHQTFSSVERNITEVYRDLEYAGARFRRIRDDIFDTFKVNFRRLEDIFNDWNKECFEISKNDVKAKHSKPILRRKIKEALEGLKEIEELGKKANRKFGTIM